MKIHVKLTEAIINESMKLHFDNSPALRRYAILFLPAALFTVGLSLIIKEWHQHKFVTNTWLGIFYIVIAVGYYRYARYRRQHAGKKVATTLGENSRFEMEIDDTELITRLADSTLRHQWNNFPEAIISRDLVLLYQPNQSFSMFHRSFFDDREFDDFITLVKAHVMAVKQV